MKIRDRYKTFEEKYYHAMKPKLQSGAKKKKDVFNEKKIEEQDFIDEKTDLEDHDDPEYPFEEKVKPPATAEAGKKNNPK